MYSGYKDDIYFIPLYFLFSSHLTNYASIYLSIKARVHGGNTPTWIPQGGIIAIYSLPGRGGGVNRFKWG